MLGDDVVIIDGSWLARRSYHANVALSNSKGNVGGVYTYVSSLIKLIREYDPKYCMACFDSPGVLEKKKAYSEYKANREPPDEGFLRQFPYMVLANEKFGISNYFMEGYEADDLIGTLVKRVDGRARWTLIISSDKDMWQLVDRNVFVDSPRGRIVTHSVIEECGVHPEQIVHWKALVGDASDNVTRFMGEKTAAKLLQEYGYLNGIYDNIDKISTRARNILVDNREAIYRNAKIVKIVDNLPVEFPGEFSVNDDDVLKFLGDMEFPTLVNRFRNWRAM